jgi:L,D-peptidoglycan transpeptidase YkuD (ErfK/YbiS/YcfS/YnhG family)
MPRTLAARPARRTLLSAGATLALTAGLLPVMPASVAGGPPAARPAAQVAQGGPASAAVPASAQSAESARRTLADRIAVPPRTRQLVTVTSRGWGATRGWLQAWRRTPDGWEQVRERARVRLGYGGWVRARQRVQSTGTTPAGQFRLPFAFGLRADPGTDLHYRRVDGDDWWPYDPRDPATYNVYQRHRSDRAQWRRGHAERLADYGRQYGYAVVVDFNRPDRVRYSTRLRQWVTDEPADTDRGGGIFLHVNGEGSTAGCVSTARPAMRWLLRWLRPDAVPRIAMGPRRYVA